MKMFGKKWPKNIIQNGGEFDGDLHPMEQSQSVKKSPKKANPRLLLTQPMDPEKKV